MKVLNRSGIVVRYREPYLRWASSIDENAPGHAESLHEDFSVYLLPEDPSGREESAPVKKFFKTIFEQELEDWCRDEALWPKRRDYAAFREWFDVRATSMVTDLSSEPLEIEDL
jgi:hypothetical protein